MWQKQYTVIGNVEKEERTKEKGKRTHKTTKVDEAAVTRPRGKWIFDDKLTPPPLLLHKNNGWESKARINKESDTKSDVKKLRCSLPYPSVYFVEKSKQTKEARSHTLALFRIPAFHKAFCLFKFSLFTNNESNKENLLNNYSHKEEWKKLKLPFKKIVIPAFLFVLGVFVWVCACVKSHQEHVVPDFILCLCGGFCIGRSQMGSLALFAVWPLHFATFHVDLEKSCPHTATFAVCHKKWWDIGGFTGWKWRNAWHGKFSLVAHIVLGNLPEHFSHSPTSLYATAHLFTYQVSM